MKFLDMGYEILFQYTSEDDLESFERHMENDISDKSELIIGEWYILEDCYNNNDGLWKFIYKPFVNEHGKIMRMKKHIDKYDPVLKPIRPLPLTQKEMDRGGRD